MNGVSCIYRDEHIIILDKEAGVASTRLEGSSLPTVEDWLMQNIPSVAANGGGLVNRLDNLTSGLIVAAFTADDLFEMRALWKKREVEKEYICLVIGSAPPEGRITTLIAHHPTRSNKMIVVKDLEEAKLLKARAAETEFWVLEDMFEYTLLRVRIYGGVRHQVRVHLSSIGFPIAGDELYKKEKHKRRDWLGLSRHFLHASRISFVSPFDGKRLEFDSPLPRDLEEALAKAKGMK